MHIPVPTGGEVKERGVSTVVGARAYLLAALSVGAAFVLRVGFDPLWGDRLAYVWFFLAVLAVARFAGPGPQIFALLAGLVLGDWFFVQPRHSLLIRDHVDQINAAIYTGVGFLVLFCVARTRRAAGREFAARDRIAGILECTSDAVYTVDREWHVTYFNQQASELKKLEVTQVLGRNHWKLWPEIVGTRFEHEYRRVMEQRQTVHFEECDPLKKQWIEVHACPFGEGMAIFFRDVSNRKRAEASRAQLAAIVESSDDAIIGASMEGLIATWNAAAERLYGYPSAAAIGRSFGMLFPTERNDKIMPMLERVRQGERVNHFETTQRTKEGALVDVSLTISPVQTTDMQIVGISITARDVSARKREEDERERLIKELQAALAEVKTLTGLLPICAQCKNIRDDKGSWNAIETYIRDRSDADFSHSICPDCAHQLYPEFAEE
jgi:PAS domain S-box-containing protein